MGKARFLSQNLITDATMLSVLSLRPGIVTAALKEGVGAAGMTPSGNYTGMADKEYIVEIDSIAGGVEVGQATFRWSDGGGAWNATGVATSAAAISLNESVSIKFTAGSGDDFALADRWYFKGINLFSPSAMLDLDRDHRYRSAALHAPNTITVDFGAAREITALILGDHNFTAGATILLEGDDADTFDSDGGAAQISEAIAWSEEIILHYLAVASTKRYWRISVTDGDNPAGYIEIGELFLGSYLELSKNFQNGYSEEMTDLLEANATPYGVERERFFNSRMQFEFSFDRMPAADVASIRGMLAALRSRSAGTRKPFWFNKDSAAPGDTWLVKTSGLPVRHRTLTHYDTTLILTEVLASV